MPASARRSRTIECGLQVFFFSPRIPGQERGWMLLADIIASSPFPRRTSAGKLDPADTKRFGFLGFGEIGAEAMLGRLSRPRCHGLLLGLGLRHLRSPVASEGGRWGFLDFALSSRFRGLPIQARPPME